MKYVFYLPLLLLLSCSNSKKISSKTNQLYQKWTLVSLENFDLSGNNAEVTIEFQKKDNRVAGIAACNNFFGTFKIDNENLSFSPLGATKKYCGEATMKLESAYFNELSNVNSYKISEGQLLLLNGSKELARFDAVKE